MTTPELIDFVKKDLANGTTKNIIESKLKAQGWNDLDIVEVFNIVEMPIENSVPMSSAKPISTMADYKPAPTGKKKVLKVILFIVIPLVLVLGGFMAYTSGFLFNTKTLDTKIPDSSNQDTNVLKENTPIVNDKEELAPMGEKEESTTVSSTNDTENNSSIVENNNAVIDPNSLNNEEYKIIEKIELKIKDMASVYYKNHINKYKGFCRSKNFDGAYQFAIQLPKGTNYKCNDSDNGWASWVKLSTKEYLCFDSTGFANYSEGLPEGTLCSQ